jgi:hypothetical protein
VRAVAILCLLTAVAHAQRGRELYESLRKPPTFTFHGGPFDATAARGASVLYLSADTHSASAKTRADTAKRLVERYGVRFTATEVAGQELGKTLTAMKTKPTLVVLVGYPLDTVGGLVPMDWPRVVLEGSSYDVPHAGADLNTVGAALSGWPDATAIWLTAGVRDATNGPRATYPPVRMLQGSVATQGTTQYDFHLDQIDDELNTLVDTLRGTHDPRMASRMLATEDEIMVRAVLRLADLQDDRIKVASFGATPSSLKRLAKGDALAAVVGVPDTWVGYIYADQILRTLAHGPVAAFELSPVRVFDSTNIASIDPAKPEMTWYGSVDLDAEYRKIWTGPRFEAPKPPPAPPPPEPLELTVYHSRDAMPKELASGVPADFDFAKYELAGQAVGIGNVRYVVSAPTRVSPHQGGLTIVAEIRLKCTTGVAHPNPTPVTEPPEVTIWKLPRASGRVWVESRPVGPGCPPTARR